MEKLLVAVEALLNTVAFGSLVKYYYSPNFTYISTVLVLVPNHGRK